MKNSDRSWLAGSWRRRWRFSTGAEGGVVNKITDRIQTGTIGALLVQIRLLQFGVQAAPPIKDSGNDLIAVNGEEFKAVSIRTTTNGTFTKPKGARLYHVLAVVHLQGNDNEVLLDQSRLFLIPHDQVQRVSRRCTHLEEFSFCRDLVGRLFGKLSV